MATTNPFRMTNPPRSTGAAVFIVAGRIRPEGGDQHLQDLVEGALAHSSVRERAASLLDLLEYLGVVQPG